MLLLPNTNPVGSEDLGTGSGTFSSSDGSLVSSLPLADAVPFVGWVARKEKASDALTLLVEENPPKLLKIFFLCSSLRFRLLAFLMTRS